MRRWLENLSQPRISRGFVTAAATLCIACAVIAFASVLGGDLEQGLLLTAVAVFSGWMATAIHQFQSRISGIDEVVHQARQRVEQSDKVLAEMRALAQRLRTSSSPEDTEENRTIH